MTFKDVVVMLSPWTNHRSDCERVTEAGDCSCGLQETLKSIQSAHYTILVPPRPRCEIDVVGTNRCKATTERLVR